MTLCVMWTVYLRTVLTIFHIEKINPNVHTIAEIFEEENAEIIKDKIKGDEILYKEKVDAMMISNITHKNLTPMIYELLNHKNGQHFSETTLENLGMPDNTLVKTLKLYFLENDKTFLGIIDENNQSILSPKNDMLVNNTMRLITTIFDFFDSSKNNYIIPIYQRAYSWDKEQWETFLEDILEQKDTENNYFFGNFLLEKVAPNKFEVIDGQQRLTTISIFMRALLNVLSTYKNHNIDLEELEEVFIEKKGNIKLLPVKYDRNFYCDLIRNKDCCSDDTPSKKRMKNAKKFFINELGSFDINELKQILDTIKNAGVTYLELGSKKDAALMFELENNRGKDLTNMEKIKSYFMYQMYVHSGERAEKEISYIANSFEDIYRLVNKIKTEEDSILIYHNHSYLNIGYRYRNLDDLKKEYKASTDKVSWIKDYTRSLKETFSKIEEFEQHSSKFAQKINRLGIPIFLYAFIIKGLKNIDDVKQQEYLFQVLEKIAFRVKFIARRANFQDHFNDLMKSFSNDVNKLEQSLKQALVGSYWSDKVFQDTLNSSINTANQKAFHYLLWEYEQSLSPEKGYHLPDISNEEIEHISPQTPSKNSGYETDEDGAYSLEFIEQYLNSIGNLVLISKSHNSSIKNMPFIEKLKRFENNKILYQQSELREFARTNEKEEIIWNSDSIKNRCKKISSFSLKRWEI